MGESNGLFHKVDISHLQQDSEPELNHTDISTYIKTWLTQIYNPTAQLVTQADSETQWDYNVNITDDNQEATVSHSLIYTVLWASKCILNNILCFSVIGGSPKRKFYTSYVSANQEV